MKTDISGRTDGPLISLKRNEMNETKTETSPKYGAFSASDFVLLPLNGERWGVYMCQDCDNIFEDETGIARLFIKEEKIWTCAVLHRTAQEELYAIGYESSPSIYTPVYFNSEIDAKESVEFIKSKKFKMAPDSEFENTIFNEDYSNVVMRCPEPVKYVKEKAFNFAFIDQDYD